MARRGTVREEVGPADLVGISDVAEIAGVGRAAVANWRSRYDDFPAPRAEPKSGPLFARTEVEAWLSKKGKRLAKPLGFEATLWAAADKLRGHVDPAEYKHVVLGLIFLKYISDAFEAKRARLESDEYADPEDPEEYRAENVFWVPPEARWKELQEAAKRPEIGALLDKAMDAIERDNSSLKGVLPREYARPTLDKRRLGELVDLIGTIGLGREEDQARDILAASTSTSWASSPAGRARRPESSTRRGASSGCSSR